jgi:hypothetical protein
MIYSSYGPTIEDRVSLSNRSLGKFWWFPLPIVAAARNIDLEKLREDRKVEGIC